MEMEIGDGDGDGTNSRCATSGSSVPSSTTSRESIGSAMIASSKPVCGTVFDWLCSRVSSRL